MVTVATNADLHARWRAAARLVASTRDVLDARPVDGVAPAPLVGRGWAACLASLDDGELDALESAGLAGEWPARTPASLRALVDEARAVCELPALASTPASSRRLRAREKPRKGAQIEGFFAALAPLAARARRVVDVGAGHGHLTRTIAERVGATVIGLERDEARVARARGLATTNAPEFVVRDVLRDGLDLAEDDCVVGLHACGELGDVAVERAAACGASIAIVGCCLQKRRSAARAPLCPLDGGDDALVLPTRLLGLGNLVAGDRGVEASRADNLAARARRLALRRLLAARGLALRPGEEIAGMNRRAAHGALSVMVARAFSLRGLAPPSSSEIDDAARAASIEHARMRRLSLPRAMLARALEVYVLLDRARFLETRGYAVAAGTVFSAEASARNLALVAARAGARR